MAAVQRITTRIYVRSAAAIIGALDAAVWLFLVCDSLFMDGSPETAALDLGVWQVATLLFVVTGAPALLLAWRDRAPRAALLLALAYPTLIVSLAALVAALLP